MDSIRGFSADRSWMRAGSTTVLLVYALNA
jgi:hypothetical protein